MASRWFPLALLAVMLAGSSPGDPVEASPETPPASTTTSSTTTTPSTTSTSSTTTTPNPSTTSISSTTTTPDPPTLAITDPEPNDVVTSAVYTFGGVTDPGCTVDVGGRYFAAVDADGTWTLDLVLRPGRNTTTITATNESGVKTSVQVSSVYVPIILRSDGLGIASIGDPMEEALSALTSFLGPPSTDRVHEAPWGDAVTCWTATGTICIDYLRVVSWETSGLLVLFSDWIRPPSGSQDGQPLPAPPNLRGYKYWGGADDLVLSTENGVTIGSTVDDLADAYGSSVRFSYEECAFNVAGFEIVEADSDAGRGLWGELSGLPDSPGTVVISVGAGSFLGRC